MTTKGVNWQQCGWQVKYFWGHFCPIFGHEKDELIYTTVSKKLDEKSSNQLYTNVSVLVIPCIPPHHLIESLINVYIVWWYLRIFIMIWTMSRTYIEDSIEFPFYDYHFIGMHCVFART